MDCLATEFDSLGVSVASTRADMMAFFTDMENGFVGDLNDHAYRLREHALEGVE